MSVQQYYVRKSMNHVSIERARVFQEEASTKSHSLYVPQAACSVDCKCQCLRDHSRASMRKERKNLLQQNRQQTNSIVKEGVPLQTEWQCRPHNLSCPKGRIKTFNLICRVVYASIVFYAFVRISQRKRPTLADSLRRKG